VEIFIDGISFPKSTQYDNQYLTQLSEEGILLKTARNAYETTDVDVYPDLLPRSKRTIDHALDCYKSELLYHCETKREAPFSYAIYLFSTLKRISDMPDPKSDNVDVSKKRKTTKKEKSSDCPNIGLGETVPNITRSSDLNNHCDDCSKVKTGEVLNLRLNDKPAQRALALKSFEETAVNDQDQTAPCQGQNEKPNGSKKGFTKTRQRTTVSKKYTEADFAFAEDWVAMAKRNSVWSEKTNMSRFNVEKFAEAIAKMRRLYDLNDLGIEALIDFIDNDEFWRTNALSPVNLFKRSNNGLTKIENILTRMKRVYTKKEKFSKAVQAVENKSWDNPFD